MPHQDREAMSDIISAKCFGCGHIVKVPSALGGKKARCRDYISAFNRGQVAQAALFYDPAPSREVQQAVARLMSDSPKYKAAEFTRTSAAEGITVFMCEYVVDGAAPQGKEITLRWKQVDADWFIADRP